MVNLTNESIVISDLWHKAADRTKTWRYKVMKEAKDFVKLNDNYLKLRRWLPIRLAYRLAVYSAHKKYEIGGKTA